MRPTAWWVSAGRVAVAATLLALSMAAFPACERGGDKLTVYSGRSHSLVDPLLESFSEETGIEVRVKYASSAAIASTILEEGDGTPADVVFLQDPGSLGALSGAGVLKRLPDGVLEQVDARFRSRTGEWVGTSGRARTVVYNTAAVDPARDLPSSIVDFTDPVWKGRLGWAPPNGSFQAFVTAMRLQLGEDATRRWLEGMKANDVRAYPEQHIYSRRRRAGRDRRRIRKPLLPGPIPQGGGPRIRGAKPLPERRGPGRPRPGGRSRHPEGVRQHRDRRAVRRISAIGDGPEVLRGRDQGVPAGRRGRA